MAEKMTKEKRTSRRNSLGDRKTVMVVARIIKKQALNNPGPEQRLNAAQRELRNYQNRLF